MTYHLSNFDAEDFIQQYWQQSAFLMRNTLHVEELIDADDLAGLATESEVESRLIISDPENEGWQLKHGPFSEDAFENLPPNHWTLLVQAVDHWIPEVRSLRQAFSFIPQWRIDDIMISFATDGGGVGPHYDQYDVFLIQASGNRVWKTGQLCTDDSDLIEKLPVKILTEFDEQEQWVMEPGDVLYLPPGLAHWGESIGNSLTISIGFRAPAKSEFISDFGHYLSSKISDFQRYSDISLANREQSPHQILPEDITRLKDILKEFSEADNLLESWLGQYMTEPKYDDMAVDTGDLSFEEFKSYWQKHSIYRNAASRLAFATNKLFVDGQCFESTLDTQMLHKLCELDEFTYNSDESFKDGGFQKTLLLLINLGALFFDV